MAAGIQPAAAGMASARLLHGGAILAGVAGSGKSAPTARR